MSIRDRMAAAATVAATALLGLGLASGALASTDTEDEIRDFMMGYLETFNSGYARDLAAHYDAPMYMLAPNGDIRDYDTPKTIRMTVKKWKRNLIRAGFDHSEWKVLNVRPLSDSTGVVSTVFERYTGSGQVMQRGAATYTVHKREGSWKIFLIHIHDPDAVMTFQDS